MEEDGGRHRDAIKLCYLTCMCMVRVGLRLQASLDMQVTTALTLTAIAAERSSEAHAFSKNSCFVACPDLGGGGTTGVRGVLRHHHLRACVGEQAEQPARVLREQGPAAVADARGTETPSRAGVGRHQGAHGVNIIKGMFGCGVLVRVGMRIVSGLRLGSGSQQGLGRLQAP